MNVGSSSVIFGKYLRYLVILLINHSGKETKPISVYFLKILGAILFQEKQMMCVCSVLP